MGDTMKSNAKKKKAIKMLVVLAFGCYNVGIVGVIAGQLAPDQIPMWIRTAALVLMVVIPFGAAYLLKQYPVKYIPPADTDTLLNIAGLLAAAGGVNLVPILNYATVAMKAGGDWWQVTLPTPDLTWPSVLFTVIALGLAMVALYRGLTDPDHMIAQIREEKRQLQRTKSDLLKVVRRTPSSDELAELKRSISQISNPKDSEELHRVLKEFLKVTPKSVRKIV